MEALILIISLPFFAFLSIIGHFFQLFGQFAILAVVFFVLWLTIYNKYAQALVSLVGILMFGSLYFFFGFAILIHFGVFDRDDAKCVREFIYDNIWLPLESTLPEPLLLFLIVWAIFSPIIVASFPPTDRN